jgi:multicomponent Na+:H+ antiporter subunit D
MTPDSLMILATAIPLGGAVLIGLSGQWPNLREAITLTTALALFACVAALVPDVLAGARPKLEIVTIMPGLLLSFALEPLGMLFAIVASFLWIMNSIYSVGYMRGIRESNQTRFYVYFAVALSSTMGVALSGNLLTLFIFYELLTISTYPLVIHKGTDEAIRGGRTYLGLLLSTSIGFFLLAILWTWNLTGTLEFTPGGILAGHVDDTMVGLLLFLYVFGIGKAALMPLHRW